MAWYFIILPLLMIVKVNSLELQFWKRLHKFMMIWSVMFCIYPIALEIGIEEFQRFKDNKCSRIKSLNLVTVTVSYEKLLSHATTQNPWTICVRHFYCFQSLNLYNFLTIFILAFSISRTTNIHRTYRRSRTWKGRLRHSRRKEPNGMAPTSTKWKPWSRNGGTHLRNNWMGLHSRNGSR